MWRISKWRDISCIENGDTEYTYMSHKGKPVYVKNGFAYRLSVERRSGGKLCRCAVRLCPGRMCILPQGWIETMPHHHKPTPVKFELERVLNVICARALATGEPVKRIVEREAAKLSPQARARFPGMRIVKRRIESRKKSFNQFDA